MFARQKKALNLFRQANAAVALANNKLKLNLNIKFTYYRLKCLSTQDWVKKHCPQTKFKKIPENNVSSS